MKGISDLRIRLMTVLVHLVIPCTASQLCGQEYVSATVVYKSVDQLPIRLNVHRPDNHDEIPVVVWIHGGALINGHRDGISSHVRSYVRNRGFALVSIDYRLAPETKLAGIIEDVEDAFRWIQGAGARKFHFDIGRIAVAGGSAGGYLTLMTGYRVEPRPRALVSLWGYGDLIGSWYSQPSLHPRHLQVKVSREQAWQQVAGPAVSDSRDRTGNGGLFYLYCRQQGLWPKHVSGWDPDTEADKFEPYMPVKNVTVRWPPTLMIHGTADTDVPHEQSLMMAREFAAHGVTHELVSVAGGEHGLAGGPPDQIQEAYEKMESFLDRFLLP